MDRVIIFLVFIVFAPMLLATALQLFIVLFGIILPWLVLFFLIAGLTAGLSAALAVRRRLPPRGAGRKLPPGLPAVKRPRGTQNRQQRESEDA